MTPAPYYADDLITIYHTDSRDHPNVLAAAGVMVTDPPYGYAYRSSWTTGTWRSEQIANDHDTTARDSILAEWGDKPAIMFGSWKAPRPADTRMVLVWDKETGPGMGDLALPWGNGWEEIYILGGGSKDAASPA